MVEIRKKFINTTAFVKNMSGLTTLREVWDLQELDKLTVLHLETQVRRPVLRLKICVTRNLLHNTCAAGDTDSIEFGGEAVAGEIFFRYFIFEIFKLILKYKINCAAAEAAAHHT